MCAAALDADCAFGYMHVNPLSGRLDSTHLGRTILQDRKMRVMWRVWVLELLLSVLYYRGVFIASISDAVFSHPVSRGLCTHTKKVVGGIE